MRREGIAWEVRVSLPAALRGCVAAKGSIAIDGISLTVMRVDDDGFEVGIIPHTLKETTLRAVKAGHAGEPGGRRAGPLRAARRCRR